MADEKMIDRAEHVLYKTYNRFPVVFDHGKGVTLWDTEGNEYLDFGAGIAVMGLGYSCDEVKNAVKEQMDKLPHISNLFYNEPAISAGEKLLAVSQMDKVFFTNSGTEAIEGALKIAKRYAYNKGMAPDYEIIAMKHSFHGRSLGALSVTGNDHYQEPFAPLIPNIRFAEFNNLDSVKALFSDKTCAVIMETIQGEGGIYPATEEFLKGVKALCEEKDLILILDDRVGQQIVHAKDAAAVGKIRALHHARVAGGRDGRADFKRRIHDRRNCRPVDADLRDKPYDLSVLRDGAHAFFQAGICALADGKCAFIVGRVPRNDVGRDEAVVLVLFT